MAMVLSADSENDPDVIAVTAASAALYISKIPFMNPIACVRVGLLDGKLVVNPTVAEQKTSLLNIVVAGTDDAIVMVESGALEVSEETVADALEFGHAEIRKIVAAIRELHARLNMMKVTVTPPAFDEALYKRNHQEVRRAPARCAGHGEASEARKLWAGGRHQQGDPGGDSGGRRRQAEAGRARV